MGKTHFYQFRHADIFGINTKLKEKIMSFGITDSLCCTLKKINYDI